MDNGIQKLISNFGSQTAIADELGITSQAVQKWRRVPVGRVMQLVQASGWKVKPWDLRPDKFSEAMFSGMERVA